MQTPFDIDKISTEEVIQIRHELVKTKHTLSKYKQFFHYMDKFNKQTDLLLQKFHSIDSHLFQICSQIGIQNQPLKIVWKEAEREGKWQNSQTIQTMVYKHQQIIKAFQKQQQLIQKVAQIVKQIVNQNKTSQDKHTRLEKDHKQCQNKLTQATKHHQKMKLVEKQLKIKDIEIMELNKMKQELEYNLAESNRKVEEQYVKIRQLEGDLDERHKEYIKIQQKQSEEQAMTFQKQKVMEKCTNIIEMLQVGPEEYLTHYFRSNGLPLESQKPQKNKYAMVFQ